MTTPREKARSALRRAVVIVAGLASIATSRAGWVLQAPLPTDARGPRQGARLVVEASQAPRLFAHRRTDQHRIALRREETGEWNGGGSYFLPPGFDAEPVVIDGHNCSEGGGMCSACQPPSGAFVRVLRVEPASAWTLTARSEERTARVRVGEVTRFAVTFDTSDASRDVELEAVRVGGPSPARATAFALDRDRDAEGHRRATTDWLVLEGGPDAAAIEVRFVVEATITGYCPASTPCPPPPGEAVRIVRVEPIETR